MKPGRLFVFLILLFLPFSASGFWPFSWELGDETHFLGPLVSYGKEGGEKHLAVRPFLFSYDSGEEGGVYHFLYPFGKSTPDKSYLVPIYASKKSGAEEDTSFVLFFHGTSEKGPYFGVFPLFGRLHNRFGKDEMSFLMWPLYSRVETEGATKTNILFPFLSLYGGRDQGYRVWPVAGVKKREGVSDSRFFLWPVFLREDKELDTDEPRHTFHAFPFYVSTTTKTSAYYSFLFPMLSYSHRDGQKKYGFLWDLYSYKEGEETGFSIFPFYATTRKDRDRLTSTMWPLYRESEWYVGEEKFSEKRLLVVNREIEEKDRSFSNVWPVFEMREEKGASTFYFPSVLPLRLPEFDRIIRPLITLVERREEGERRTVNVLYGLYTREEKGENWKQRLGFIFEARKDESGHGFELLGGLFGIEPSRIKVFFVPIKR